jgi:hypothetical protein
MFGKLQFIASRLRYFQEGRKEELKFGNNKCPHVSLRSVAVL